MPRVETRRKRTGLTTTIRELPDFRSPTSDFRPPPMPSPRVLILRAPGTNCDGETAHAFSLVGGQVDVLHVNRLLEQPSLYRQYQILCIPGGFSFGDDIASG